MSNDRRLFTLCKVGISKPYKISFYQSNLFHLRISGLTVHLDLIFHMFIHVMDGWWDVLVFGDKCYEIKFPSNSEQTINMMVQSRHSWKLDDKNIPRTTEGHYPHLFIPHPLKWKILLAQLGRIKVEWLVGLYEAIKGLYPFKLVQTELLNAYENQWHLQPLIWPWCLYKSLYVNREESACLTSPCWLSSNIIEMIHNLGEP